MTPEEALFQAHVEGVAFRSGIDRDRWGFPSVHSGMEWPHLVVWIEADNRFVGSGHLDLRFDLTGYPATAPTALPWDVEKSEALPPEKWPKGPGNIARVFNPVWNRNALYAPCDRVAMVGHDPWKTSLSQWWWTADSDITLYLEFVHRCLNPCEHEH